MSKIKIYNKFQEWISEYAAGDAGWTIKELVDRLYNPLGEQRIGDKFSLIHRSIIYTLIEEAGEENAEALIDEWISICEEENNFTADEYREATHGS